MKNNKLEFRVVEVSEKETTGKSRGIVVLKSISSNGTSQIKMMIDPDDTKSYAVGELYNLTLNMIPATAAD